MRLIIGVLVLLGLTVVCGCATTEPPQPVQGWDRELYWCSDETDWV